MATSIFKGEGDYANRRSTVYRTAVGFEVHYFIDDRCVGKQPVKGSIQQRASDLAEDFCLGQFDSPSRVRNHDNSSAS